MLKTMDRCCENKRKVREVEKESKYELRRWEFGVMGNIVKELGDVARRHNRKMLYCILRK